MRRILAFALALLALGGLAAQNKTSLNIICNEGGAQVYINGRLAGTTTPNFSFLIPQGKVQVRVQKNGFQTFETIVQATAAPIMLNVNLQRLGVAPQPVPPPQPVTHSLTVNATNVSGAEVLLNGVPAGRTPFSSQLPQGSYALVLRAPGFGDFSQTVVVNGPTQINATLQPIVQQLTVSSNVQGAQVLLNGTVVGKTPYQAAVAPGSYALVVRAPGFLDFSQNVVVNGSTQVNATLEPALQQLTVSSNVQGAQVLLNGATVGKTPYAAAVAPGSYVLVVRAPGYLDFTQNVVVSGPAQINANLEPVTHQLSVDAVNVKGAQVLLNGNAAGQTGFATRLLPGSYTLTIRAPGFQDYVETFDLQGPKTVSVTLQAALAGFQINLAAANINTELGGKHWGQIQILIDGNPQTGPIGQVTPGRHRVKIVAGGLQAETVIDFQAGKSYVIEPVLSVGVK